jgi:AAA+ superfamily predicted ATPase
MIQLSGRYRRWQNTQSTKGVPQESLVLWETVPSDLLMYCWPALVGFSFTTKAWGHVLISGLSEIQFHDEAFDQLVLPDERKQLIRALVRFGGDQDTNDIVGGKCGGSIFLLHGPPGVGKTLTAEAIAEVLHRPLYYVTMGELGLNPEDMERRLSDVLDLCAGWDALILLDEADVFLEKRSSSDIVRNAMVCVMLRLLEYHPGILFLTTNRVRSFDPAFESRVTVALRYENLGADARVQVWKNLLKRVSVAVSSDVQYDALGQHALNGRQIKNSVRLAVALTRERQCAVTQAILDTTLQITTQGRQEMKHDSWDD